VDALTGLANRRQLDERLTLALGRLHRHGMPVALMFLDVDHFKRINDTWGHAAGDRVLCSFADRLQRCVRAPSIWSRDWGAMSSWSSSRQRRCPRLLKRSRAS